MPRPHGATGVVSGAGDALIDQVRKPTSQVGISW
jgi:hypothetical protein